MGQRSIRIPDELDAAVVALAKERGTSATEVIIWATRKFLGMDEQFLARQDRRTVSGRVPVAEGSVLPSRGSSSARELQGLQNVADVSNVRTGECPVARCSLSGPLGEKCPNHPNMRFKVRP